MLIEALLRRHVAGGGDTARWRSPGEAWTRWRPAASATSSAAASTATRRMPTGWSRTSSRCSTTTRSSRACTCTPGRSRATPAYLETATGTLDYLLRELRMPEGGFAASQDADTDGEEGATFVWSAAEIREVLGADAALFAAAYGATDGGNWEGHTILSRIRDDAELGERFGLEPAAVGERLAAARRLLLERRAARPQPARDDKVLAAWNGLAIGALADAARALGAAGRPELDLAAARYRERGRGGGRRGHVRAPGRGRAPASLVEGRPSDRGRRARGLREPGRGPPRPVRGDLRRALVRGRRRPRRRHPGPVRRSGRGVLRHRRRWRSRSWSARRASGTTPSPPAGRWRPPSCCGWPR